jgi:hypothetical protein
MPEEDAWWHVDHLAFCPQLFVYDWHVHLFVWWWNLSFNKQTLLISDES